MCGDTMWMMYNERQIYKNEFPLVCDPVHQLVTHDFNSGILLQIIHKTPHGKEVIDIWDKLISQQAEDKNEKY